MILLLDAALKVSAILLVGIVGARLLCRSSAAMRHLVLVAGFCCAAASPLLTHVVPSWTVELATPRPGAATAESATKVSVTSSQASVPGTSDAATATTSPEPGHAAFGVSRAVVVLWIAGVAITMTWLVSGLGALASIARGSAPVTDSRWVKALQEAASRQGLPAPLLLHSAHPALVATWGVVRPKVIVPTNAMNWSDDRIRVVLDHELAHVRRRDWFIDRGAAIVRCLFWPSPVAWWACRRLRQESEHACDDVVLKNGVVADMYASHLLALARAARRRPWLPAAAMARPSSLERRIRMMLSSDVNRNPVTPIARWGTAALLLTLSLPVITFDALGQARFATISGVVTDESGAVLVDASLSLSHPQTGTRYEVRSNQGGAFQFVGVTAGRYDFAAQRLGFEPAAESVTIGVGETLQKNLSLRVSSVQEVITVVGGAERPDTSGADRRVVTAPAPTRRPCPDPAVGGCIRPPVKTKDVRPVYPAAPASAGLAGKVIIQGVIGTDGRMKDMRVVSSPHPDLERAALEAVGQWEFRPTTLNERVIETRINVDVGFSTSPSP